MIRPPLILLTGFLGAGKTTCLRTLLDVDRRRGCLPGVLVNDFGDLAVDATLLGSPERLVTLVDGCLCCSLQDDLLLGVLALLDAGANRIYIEPSGLADPIPLLETLAVPDLIARIGTLLVIAVTRSDTPPLDDPAAVELWELQWRLADHRMRTDREDFVLSEVPAIIDALLARPAQVPRSLEGIGVGHPLGWQTTTIAPDAALTSTEFDVWLQQLPDTIYRIKGFVRFADRDGWWLVQGVGTDRRRYPWPGDPGAAAGLVLIGSSP